LKKCESVTLRKPTLKHYCTIPICVIRKTHVGS
jgi:hypothetical protein